ncbi:MAG: serine protease [Thermonema sp.]|uniref:trypsin-like peptidase domain-containing protein n=1 Tax=Thermonema sp. TaxID=2231181 RepID=UPI0021DE1AC9|nr:trypsin-like peptidase domain-containing protein [Thermonema sp.]GIV39496.1 MAG: serine protease [Thermonema sp.]
MSNKIKNILLSPFAGGAAGAVVVLLLFQWWSSPSKPEALKHQPDFSSRPVAAVKGKVIEEGVFLQAANKAAPAIVHIKSRMRPPQEEEDYHIYSFHDRSFNVPRTTTGSGVLISEDGYLITNYHVIEGAYEIQVLLWDQRYFEAEVIGIDSSTDLALLKIDADGLAFLPFGNSDQVQVGEWVLALGNPFDLSFTVTAGIISAKARNINIIREEDGLQIESFLQTDAVVNPGNSGGALVNLRGELIGINTAIASQTGSYSGYSFAVPSNLVRKVAYDLLEYGEVQRAILGVQIQDLDIETARAYKLPHLNGVLIRAVNANSGAEEAGLKAGDIILMVDSLPVRNMSELQERIALHYPGEVVKVTFLRDGKTLSVSAKLRNVKGGVTVAKKVNNVHTFALGGEWANLSREELSRYELESGARLLQLRPGPLFNAGLEKGFIVTELSINGKKVKVKSATQLAKLLRSAEAHRHVLYMEGIYPNGSRQYYPIEW